MDRPQRSISPVPVILVTGLALAPAVAQEPPTFEADVERVIVDAVVLDGEGAPVAGLGPEDFELRDEGEPREILSFEALDVAAVPVAPSREARRVASNMDNTRSERVMAVFWDDVHLSLPSAERARRALRPWLAERLLQGDRVILASAGGAWLVTEDATGEDAFLGLLDELEGNAVLLAGSPDYVSDHEAVAISQLSEFLTYEVVYRRFGARGVPGCAVARVPPGEIWRRRLGDPCPVLLRAREVALTARTRLEATLRALAHLADVLAVGQGRKSIVLVSEGFLQHPGASRAFAAVARAAQQANAVLSVLDPAGVRVAPDFSAVSMGAPASEDQALAHANALADQAGSESLARDTGGLVLHTNDLGAGLARITRESQTHYLLGFAPAPGAETGSFREILLKVRRSGLTVRARSRPVDAGRRLTLAPPMGIVRRLPRFSR